jgi:hypothetical protein
MKWVIAALLAACLSTAARARPVSYEGGTTALIENDSQSTAIWVHYTPHHQRSFGARAEWNREDDFVFVGGQATFLNKRWFGDDHQGNLYTFAGAGGAEGISDNPLDPSLAAFLGVLADWETRSLFVSYKARAMVIDGADRTAMQAARIGFAPYEGDFGDLHTWLMVEVDHSPERRDAVGVTPLIRFFKGPLLLEFGYNVTVEEPLFNLAYRF